MSYTFYGENRDRQLTCVSTAGVSYQYAEPVRADEADELNLANMNAVALLRFLGLPTEECGSASIAEARRAVMRASATFESRADEYVRPEEREYGAPRDRGDGVIELRPLRFFGGGLDVDRMRSYLERLGRFIEIVAARGATHIYWA